MMNEGLLLIGFLILLVIACSIALYPLRPFQMSYVLWVLVLVILVGIGYWSWGAWPSWTQNSQNQAKKQHAQALLNTVRNPEELIDKLKATLNKQPNSARGWYLLGRLYASQNRWESARDAFASAHQCQPDDEQISVNYAHSLWQLHHQAFDKQSRGLLKQVLKKNPDQPDALGMLAMDAYARHDYQQAIDYWQRVLTVAPPQSEDADAIRKAIADAQKKMTQSKASP